MLALEYFVAYQGIKPIYIPIILQFELFHQFHHTVLFSSLAENRSREEDPKFLERINSAFFFFFSSVS